MEDEAKNPMHPVLLILLGSLGYCYFFVTKIPKGILRLLFLLPIFYLFSILPWHFPSAFGRGISSFFIAWITSFKLLLFSFDRGPLFFPHKNFFDFALVSVFPLKIKENISPSPNQPLIALTKLLLGTVLPILILFYAIYKENNSPKFTLFLYGLTALAWLYVFGTMVRYELVPLLNHPYFATSLQDFWGRRWNRMSSDILRQSVYDPTRDTLMGVIGFGPAKVVAIITTLVVSGIMHEMVLYYITCGKKPTWEMAWFFVLHGLCMVMEAGLKQLARQRGWGPVPPAVSIILTVGLAIVTCNWWLVLPVWRSSQRECRFR
ncbi:hypothetical protein L484_013639 [Morus notabilis]|uniref:Wax synthase domain-containing protein n=1 Tax=Morus notabilis TaxID=981085 RepID=W9QUN8_9ROSA|nr:probable long-chain-alcohol O-fatty-acyltransferase 3 [Morus notabilis]EXB41562.1 hypothetical protein L484_013639 [Morus notabilis]